jgi:hypothetical protein
VHSPCGIELASMTSTLDRRRGQFQTQIELHLVVLNAKLMAHVLKK